MKQWSLLLQLEHLQIPLTLSAPTNVSAIDDYREVNFLLPGKGPHRAVFFLLPDNNSLVTGRQIMPMSDWTVPVRWDDNTMLFVPGLDDDSILQAMVYILQNGHEDSAFENEADIAASDH